MPDNRSNAFVGAMNGLMQQAERAARGFRAATNFISIAYLRLSKLKDLPATPFDPAVPHGAAGQCSNFGVALHTKKRRARQLRRVVPESVTSPR
jgi:hypothetical protein